VQRLAGPIVVQRTLAETVKRVATAIGVVATVGAIAAYFFIPTAVAYAVLGAAGGLGTALIITRLQAGAGEVTGTGSGTGGPPSGTATGGDKDKKGANKSGKKKKKKKVVVVKPLSASEQMDELQNDLARLVEERQRAEGRYKALQSRKERIRQQRQNIRQVGYVPVDGNPDNRFVWLNAPNSQVYDNRQGYLPPGAYTEYYRDITGGARHHRMVRENGGDRRWFTYGGTHEPVPGAWWAYWNGNRWWRWVGPTDAGGAGLGVATEYGGYPVTDIPNGDKLTELEVLLLDAHIASGMTSIAVDQDLVTV